MPPPPRPNSGISMVGIKKLSVGLDAETFLAKAGVGKTVVSLKKKDAAFSQGDASDAVFFIKKGKLQLTVVSKAGKEATLGILSAGEFSEKVAWLDSLYAGRLQPQ